MRFYDLRENSEVEYKEIVIDGHPKLSGEEKALLSGFQNHFRADELKVETENLPLRLLLRSVDFSHFERVISDLSRGTSPQGTSLLFALFDAISNVRSYGLKAGKRVYVGYADERKVKNRSAKEARRGKYFYAKDNTYKDQQAETPAQFRDKIICGDSKVILAQMPNNCVDLVFTSPPYNFGLDYSRSPDDFDWESYFGKLFEIFDECIRVLKYGGRIIVNIQPLFSDYIPSHHIISGHLLKKKMIWKGEILWEKNNYNCKYTAWGSWKSPSSPYLKYTWEFLEIFCKGSLKKFGSKDNIDISTDEFKKWVVGKWSIAPERHMKEHGHPAMFPEELVRRVIKLFSYQSDLILDPFNGAGTTTLCAKKANRRYLGIDVSQDYCDAAQRRLDEILI